MLGQVFLLQVSMLPSQRAMDLPEEWLLLASQSALPGFLQRLNGFLLPRERPKRLAFQF